MKKVILTGILLTLAAFALSAQNLPSIRIVNNTGYSIYSLYVSPSDSDLWGDDLLEEDILENGQTFTYRLPKPLNEKNVYDIGAEDEDGDVYFKWKVTINNNARIIFTADDMDAEDSD